jgi:GTP pyrophosphokinase
MATADRVLPWRRVNAAPQEDLAPLIASYRRRHPKANVQLITRAYESARTAHRDQTRSSGESYINHPLAVARIVAELGLDETTIAAALLHDAVEDTELTIEQVQHEFGAEVGSIVDGVTKLDRLQFDSREAQQAATMRKMLVAMARDLRVLIIKLADRLHNMRTIAAMPAEKQRRIAQETMDIYAPLAHRLGMQELKQQLEDLSFAALFPKRYSELDNLVFTRTPERDVYLASMIAEIQSRLNSLRITCEVTGRGKHMWSIYEKMVQRGKEFDEIFDLVAVRIIVDSVKDCYGALGCIHGQWKPVVGRFKDYIAMPKFNLYQSLHTTVIGPQGKPLEVQIRTRDMHNRAEWGVAAHWSYKEGSSGEIDWLDRIVDWQSDLDDPTQFLEDLRTDLDQDELFVFTPKGRVISLPIGGSPVDFAYAVHTEVGHKCTGAKVNGRLVALDTILQSGDTCEIVTAKDDTIGPSEDWLRFVKSPRAKNKIKQWFSRERRDEMLERGMDTLNKEFRRLSLPLHTIWDSDALATEVEAAKFGDIDALLVSIGEGQSSARSVAQRIFKRISGGDDEEQISIARPTDGAPRRRRQSAGVHVDGIDDVLVRLSRCCTPVPGDEIVGFVTKGRGVSVHRADCANAIQLQADLSIRMIEVEWSRERNDTTFRAGVEVVALDRSRLLRDVANAISESHVNIVACSTHTGGDRVAKMRFEFELADPSYLAGIMRTIKSIDGVYDAYRIVPGR